jgi:hypothetical protein
MLAAVITLMGGAAYTSLAPAQADAVAALVLGGSFASLIFHGSLSLLEGSAETIV